MTCLFCKIINREIKADIVYEDDQVLAFRDIAPQAPVHILVIPKKHVAKTSVVGKESGEMLAAIFGVIQQIVVQQNLTENGFRVVLNEGADAGQAVAHLHFHVLSGRKMKWPPG